ncbi:FkbM family methyltransferase [Pseudomonas chengduensis]|nr:FkbM family methyltransferase [Pseudomonas chengduensis]MDH1623631.1 FkbM family methyltransferase [Pseudomonas chengduensis]
MTIRSRLESKMPASIIEIYRYLKFRFWHKLGKKTWSQEGEDIILERIFKNKRDGFYVDVGAHHPYKYSNTYLLHRKGWTGINIDPSPLTIELFDRHRKEDINLNFAISQVNGLLDFFVFQDGAYNTLSKEMANSVQKNTGVKIKNVIKVEARRLEDVLMDELPSGKKIDLMSIDVEGLDLDVLKSNNWTAYSPDVLLVESQWMTLVEVLDGEIYQYITQRNYTLYSKLINTLIFVKS